MGGTAHIVVGLGFGDEGKGSVVDFLARRHRASTVVRYNGGPQAAHRVVCDDGRAHVFSQFGAGTFVPGVRTHLSRHMLVNPLTLHREMQVLTGAGVTDAMERLSVDAEALIVTPFHVVANRIRETLRGAGRHGSCGMGIGEAREDSLNGLALRAGDLLDPARTREILYEIQRRKRVQMDDLIARHSAGLGFALQWMPQLESVSMGDVLTDQYREILAARVTSDWAGWNDDESVVFEGAQGVLLDEAWGFQPHTTWTNTTAHNARWLLSEAGWTGDVSVVGVTRAYATRHGAGPLPTENRRLTAEMPDAENVDGEWQGSFRSGWFDLPLLSYAASATGGVDEIAVTCLDRVAEMPRAGLHRWRAATDYADGYDHIGAAVPIYEGLEPTPEAYRDLLGEIAPVTIESYGPTAAGKKSLALA